MKRSNSKTQHILLGVSDSPLLPVQSLAGKIQLSELEAQLLKRDLLTRAIQRETEYLFSTNFVRAICPKSSTEPTLTEVFHKKKPLQEVDVSFLKHFFDHYVKKFPFLINTDLPKFLDKLEKFQDEVVKANLSSDAERSETTKRKLIILRIQKLLVLLYNNAIPIVTEGFLTEESFPHEPKQEGLGSNLISTLPKEDIEVLPGVPHLIDIVGVCIENSKGTFRLSSHAKFIIRVSKRENGETVFSYKRFDDFKALLVKLRKKFPLLELPVLPDKVTSSPLDARLIREQDRMNIRSTIRRLMANPEVAGCSEFYQFLVSDLGELSEEDKQDIATRKSHMVRLAEDRKKYINYLTFKALEYKAFWKVCKDELVKPGGLSNFEEMLRKTPQVKDLPTQYLGALEWGRLNFASFLYIFFCTTDDSVRFFQSLCSTHKLIPYRAIAVTLRFTNPTGMAKAVMDLLLAQPFGSTSLMQRILTANLSDQARDAAKEINIVERRVDEDVLCQRIRNYVYFPEQRSEELLEGVSDFERLTIIINDPQIQPELTAESIVRFCSARDWIDQLRAGKNPPVQASSDGILMYPEFDFLEGLHQLFVLHNRKRDAEKISELMFQGVTGELMKDLLSVFYGPLAQVYKDANISDFVLKISLFIDDLIVVIQQVSKFQDSDVKDSEGCGKLQHFLDLIQRHEQAAYAFIHSIYSSNSNSLFRNLLEWMESFLTAIRNKVTGPIDMQALVDANIAPLDAQPLKLELNWLAAYQQRRKARQMRNLRRKIINADAEDGLGDLEQLINSDRDDLKSSSINFGFGSLAVEDLRELQELDSMQKIVSHDPVRRQTEHQAKLNADPSEPMVVWLNTSTENILPLNTHQTESSASVPGNDDTPSRIAKFIVSKAIANISQEPYPEGIKTIPALLNPFIESVQLKLR